MDDTKREEIDYKAKIRYLEKQIQSYKGIEEELIEAKIVLQDKDKEIDDQEEEIIGLKRSFSSLQSDYKAVSYTHLTLPTKRIV